MTVTNELIVNTGVDVDVTIDGATVFDEFGTPILGPDRVPSGGKTYYVTAGQIRVSIRRNGLELATTDGKPLYLNMPRDAGIQLSPVPVGDAGDLTVDDLTVNGILTASSNIVDGNIQIMANGGGNIGIQGDAGVGLTASDGPITITPDTYLALYDGAGLDIGDRPTIAAATDLASVVAGFNTLRTALLALGVIV